MNTRLGYYDDSHGLYIGIVDGVKGIWRREDGHDRLVLYGDLTDDERRIVDDLKASAGEKSDE